MILPLWVDGYNLAQLVEDSDSACGLPRNEPRVGWGLSSEGLMRVGYGGEQSRATTYMQAGVDEESDPGRYIASSGLEASQW